MNEPASRFPISSSRYGAMAVSKLKPRGPAVELAARALKAGGVSHVFTLCGDHVNSLLHAISRNGIQIVGARHESAAVQMADGWARATGSPGVAVVTGGPGHSNAITGAATAQGAQSPVVVISGQAPKARRERGGNQSLHQADLMRPVTKWAVEAEDPASLGELLMRALMVALAGTPGTVSVSIPTDIADAVPENGVSWEPAVVPTGPASDRSALLGKAPKSVFDGAARLIAAAKSPVLVLGGSAWRYPHGVTLSNTVRRLGIPAFTNGHARGVVADDGRHCFGFANPMFNVTFREARDADLFIFVGTGVDYSLGSGKQQVVRPDARIVQIHCDPHQIGVGRLPDCALVGDHQRMLHGIESALGKHAGAAAWAKWRHRLELKYAEQQQHWLRLTRQLGQSGSTGGLHPAILCSALRRFWTPDTTVVVDVGDFANWPKAYFPVELPIRYMDGGALGNLGGALPTALGVQLARPDSPVWTFIGDGGFGFHGWELSMAAERRLPIKVIVGNDRAWGTEKRLQRLHFRTDLACDLPDIRYDRFAALLGLNSFHAGNTAELDNVITPFMNAPGPALLNVGLARLAGRPFDRTGAPSPDNMKKGGR